MYLISDNVDTQMGMRLAGIEGVVVHDQKSLEEALTNVLNQEDIGILLLTSVVFDMDREHLLDMKLNLTSPLIVEVSDRHQSHEVQSMIDETIAKIIGKVV
ncbi:MAG: V-type ATP synthase subunit F [Erysipelothrix sp.]